MCARPPLRTDATERQGTNPEHLRPVAPVDVSLALPWEGERPGAPPPEILTSEFRGDHEYAHDQFMDCKRPLPARRHGFSAQTHLREEP